MTTYVKYAVWRSAHLLLPGYKVNNMGAKTRKRIGLIITNGQNMYICENSLILKTQFHFFFIITVADDGENDVYAIVRS